MAMGCLCFDSHVSTVPSSRCSTQCLTYVDAFCMTDRLTFWSCFSRPRCGVSGCPNLFRSSTHAQITRTCRDRRLPTCFTKSGQFQNSHRYASSTKAILRSISCNKNTPKSTLLTESYLDEMDKMPLSLFSADVTSLQSRVGGRTKIVHTNQTVKDNIMSQLMRLPDLAHHAGADSKLR